MDTFEPDYHNFSSSSSHRLPTLSGTQAIRNAINNARPIPTSLPLLDETLGSSPVLQISSGGGIQRGLVTEVFGPPGVGKTTFALQLAVNAVQAVGSNNTTATTTTSVTWIDTSTELLQTRLRQLMETYRLPPGHDPPSSPPLPQYSRAPLSQDHFNYMQIRSLPKLLTLFLHPSDTFPPPNTGLIVLDDLSHLILSSLPNSTNTTTSKRTKAQQQNTTTTSVQDAALTKRILSRRFQVLSSFASGLQKFAASHNVAVLVTSKAAVNLKAGQKAVLRPALSSQQWDNYLSVRIALFRDFWPDEASSTQASENVDMEGPTEFERRTVRFAKVVRLAGKLVSSSEVAFVIEEGGLRQAAANLNESESSILPLATQPLRPLEDVLDTDAIESDDPVDGNEELTENDEPETTEVLSQQTLGRTKRKAIEITDSDDDNTAEDGHDSENEAGKSLGTTTSQENGFQPSSQVYRQASQTEQETSFVTAKEMRADATALQGENEDEMLLETYEKTFAPLSQAGAEMSDPLTPSDDGRDIS